MTRSNTSNSYRHLIKLVLPGRYGSPAPRLRMTLIPAIQERFKVPYMHCGCPLPDPTIGQRLHKVWNVLKTPMNALLPSSRTDVLLSTHASEHNMGAMDPHYRSLQVRKLQKRRWRDEERSRGGRMDPALLTRGVAHDYAFLAPDKKLHLKAGAPECIVGMTPLVHSTGSATGASSAPVVSRIDVNVWDRSSHHDRVQKRP